MPRLSEKRSRTANSPSRLYAELRSRCADEEQQRLRERPVGLLCIMHWFYAKSQCCSAMCTVVTSRIWSYRVGCEGDSSHLLALAVAIHAGTGCAWNRPALLLKVPCCGQNCPISSAVGESGCCHSQGSGFTKGSGFTAREVSGPSVPVEQPLVGLMPVPFVSSARTAHRADVPD
jgi:hypothetical protein